MAKDISVPHTFQKEGIFYFERRIPRDLLRHYDTPKISYSLRTRTRAVAAARARRAADQLDEYWYHLRVQSAEVPGKHRLRMAPRPATVPEVPDEESVRLSEAVRIYLQLKGHGRPKTFHRAAERSCGYVIDICGDKELLAYSKADANAFRDGLIARGMAGSSITRTLGTVRAVMNFAASETGLSMHNPFSGVYYDRSMRVEERTPLSIEDIMMVQKACRHLDDDRRWLVALVSDTGMRLAEAAGLLVDDIKLSDDIPHVVVQEHSWRRLKTKGSRRLVPLVGASLWAAQRVLEASKGGRFAFSCYRSCPGGWCS